MEEHPVHFGWKLAHRFHEQYSISNLAVHSFFMLSSDRYVIHFVLRTSLANFQIRSYAQSLSRHNTTVIGKSQTHDMPVHEVSYSNILQPSDKLRITPLESTKSA